MLEGEEMIKNKKEQKFGLESIDQEAFRENEEPPGRTQEYQGGGREDNRAHDQSHRQIPDRGLENTRPVERINVPFDYTSHLRLKHNLLALFSFHSR